MIDKHPINEFSSRDNEAGIMDHHVSGKQAKAFQKALCDRLGLDPKQISEDGITIETSYSADNLMIIRWEGIALLSVDDVADLFNAAGHAADE